MSVALKKYFGRGEMPKTPRTTRETTASSTNAETPESSPSRSASTGIERSNTIADNFSYVKTSAQSLFRKFRRAAPPRGVSQKAAEGDRTPTEAEATGASGKGDMNAVFQQLQGVDATKLKKKGHFAKDADKATPKAPAKATARQSTSSKSEVPRGAPRFELMHNMDWIVENQYGNKDIKVDKAELRHSVQTRDSKDSSVRVEQKVNSAVIENCENCTFVFQDLISSIEVIRSKRIRIQILGVCPSFNLDNVTTINVYLSAKGKNAQFATANINEVNVHFPSKDDPEEYVERPIPQQYIHTIDTSTDKISSKVSELYY